MATKVVLVTGINGFVGPHLARELKQRQSRVIGIGFGEATAELKQLIDQYISLDLTDPSATTKIDFTNIDAVIHLAGLSSPAQSFTEPQHFIAANSAMLINLFETALAQKPARLPRFVVISSGAIYDTKQPMPLTEQTPLADTSPYAISKILNEHLTNYYQTRGFLCTTVRPFNHIGPGQAPGFLIPDLVSQVLAAGDGGTIHVGDLSTKRDFTDVRDIVKGYADIALAENLHHSSYNLCSGKTHSGNDILQLVVTTCFGSAATIKTTVDKAKLRPNDVNRDIAGDATRAHTDFGWQPIIPLPQSIQDYVTELKKVA